MWHGPLRTTSPASTVNDDLILDQHYWHILLKHQSLFQNQNYQNSVIIGNANDKKTQFSADFFNQCLVYVITETLGEHPYPYFSEKTWKAIVSKTPFMMVNAPGSLKKLQEFGFKTFDHWWDESYDLLPTVAQRIEALVIELKKLSALDLSQLAQLRKDIKPVIDYNYKHLSCFIETDLDNIRKSL
jgi:hypothetical protein